MSEIVNVSDISKLFRTEIRNAVEASGKKFNLVGFLSAECAGPSKTYASYARTGAADVGIDFNLIEIPRIDLERAILAANEDDSVHGIMVYYPIFGLEQDNYIKDLVDYRKDVEGLNVYWARKLYADDRTINGDADKRAILPCTPLAIVKILEELIPYKKHQESPLKGVTATIFNRSEVVGRPLAAMLSNDGAKVYSFDLDGPLMFEGKKSQEVSISRSEALSQSDIIIGGVPSSQFDKIRGDEIKGSSICLNFSSVQNFDPSAQEKARKFVPRVGPVTISMLLRNGLRLRNNFS